LLHNKIFILPAHPRPVAALKKKEKRKNFERGGENIRKNKKAKFFHRHWSFPKERNIDL
jgi:hypothetical protein